MHGAVAEVGDDVDPLLLGQELYLGRVHDGLELRRGLVTVVPLTMVLQKYTSTPRRYRVTRFN